MATQTRAPLRVKQPATVSNPPAPPVLAAGMLMLEQCAGFVDAVGDRPYATESVTHRGGTIGKHVRHVLDHFRAALDGADSKDAIAYDQRARNVPMETDRAEAVRAIAGLRERLGILREADLSRAVRVRVMVSGDGVEAELGSTLGRELAFASHHAVHHHAMLKAIAAEFGIDAGEQFGKAPSTLNNGRVRR